jgi:hypothetical protein
VQGSKGSTHVAQSCSLVVAVAAVQLCSLEVELCGCPVHGAKASCLRELRRRLRPLQLRRWQGVPWTPPRVLQELQEDLGGTLETQRLRLVASLHAG